MKKETIKRLLPVAIILIIALLVRVYAFIKLDVINTDSTVYLYHAYAVSKGLWNEAKSCGYPFVSLYPVAISIFHIIIPDWINAGKAVNLFFGVLTLVPVYLLSQRFLTRKITLLVLLIFALNPVLVRENVDIMKDTLFWFFNTMGIYLFVVALDKQRKLLLFFSSLLFILGTLARIEGVVFFLATLIFLIYRRSRIKEVITFGFPVLGLSILILLSLFISKDGETLWNIYFQPRLETIGYFKNPFNNPLTEKLKELDSENIKHIPPGFFKYVKTHLWILALGILFTKTVGAFFYPFFLFFVAGFKRLKRRLETQPLAKYFVFLVFVSLTYLYLFTLNSWIMEKRYVAGMIFPAFILIGWGLENIYEYLRGKGLKETVIFSLCLLLISTTFFENLKSRRTDKLVYREIGEFIKRDNHDKTVRISTSSVWVNFYANYGKELICPQPLLNTKDLIDKDCDEILSLLKAKGMDYLLWEEKEWQDASCKPIKLFDSVVLEKIGHWEMKEWKGRKWRLILFKINRSVTSPLSR